LICNIFVLPSSNHFCLAGASSSSFVFFSNDLLLDAGITVFVSLQMSRQHNNDKFEEKQEPSTMSVTWDAFCDWVLRPFVQVFLL
jgi:hypothetical protein